MANKTLPNLPAITATLNTWVAASNADGLLGKLSITNLKNIIGVAANLTIGTAIPSTNPGAATGNRMWVASTAGTYTNFSGIVIAANEVAFLVDTGTNFVKVTIPIDISGKADTATVTALSASLTALDADVYRKAYIDSITSLGTSFLPSDRTATTFASAIVSATYFGEWAMYTGVAGRALSKLNVKTYGAGTLTVGFFRITGTTATLLGSQDFTVAGAGTTVINRSDITAVNLTTLEASQLYIAIKGTTAQVFHYVDNGSGSTGYSFTGAIVTTATTAINNFSFSYWIELGTISTPLTNSVVANTAAVALNTTNISNVSNMVSGTLIVPSGRSGGLVSTTNNTLTNYYWGEYATAYTPAAPLSKVFVKVRGAGTYYVGFFRVVGTTYTKLAEKSLTAGAAGIITLTATDFTGIDLTFPGESKVYLGLRPAAASVTSYFDTGVSNTGWSYQPYTNTTGTLANNSFAHDIWIETTTSTIAIVEAVKALQASTVSGEINLTNCSKIVCIGDSYTESYYALKGKSWINILSGFLDWNLENYGISGINMPGLITNLRNNVSSYEGVAPQSYNGTYAIIASHTNDYTAGIMNGTVHLETYLNNMRTLCRIVKSLGMIPVMCSEWVNIAVPNGTTSYSDLIGASLSMLAYEEGGIYIDVLLKAEPMQGNLNTPFFGGNHPGTRSNSLVWYTLLREIQSKLPRPKTSLKLFKLRSTVTVSTVADVYFKDNLERVKLFQEIQVSENRIADAQANYYDDLDYWVTTIGASRLTTRESEYLKLRKGVAITMTDYSLISCVLPTDKKNITALSLTISDTTVAVYYKDVLNDAWVSVTNTAGVITLSAADISKALDYDKIAFLLYKSGGFTLTSAKVNYAGISEKDLTFNRKKELVELATTELLTNQTVTALTGWTVTGTLTPTVDVNGVLPTGITRYVDLTTANWLRQTVTFAASTVRRRMQVKAWVRVFPTKFTYSDTWPTNSAIKLDTYDFATLEISVRKDTNNIAYSAKNVVPLWNTEVLIECDIPPNITTLDVGFRSMDKTIQFMWASVKISS
jgi:hypothetical protein